MAVVLFTYLGTYNNANAEVCYETMLLGSNMSLPTVIFFSTWLLEFLSRNNINIMNNTASLFFTIGNMIEN